MLKFDDFVSLIASIDDTELLQDFLVSITTPRERQELTNRLDIVYRLLDGQSQHKIAKELGVGIATVTRGAREISQGSFKALRHK